MDCKVSTEQLGALPLLKGMEQADLNWLLHNCEFFEMEKGQILLSPDQDNDTIYIVISGKLIVEFDNDQVGMNTHIEEGGWVGEMSVIDKVRPSAIVKADESIMLMAIQENVWWELIDRSHIAARNFLHAVSRRLRQNNELLAEGMQKQLIFSEKAQTDSLTGLRNRHWLEENMPELIRKLVSDQSDCSVLMMDIDHFKQFNDRYGHLAGDRVLQSVSTIVRNNLRGADAAIRFGGEELILVLPGTNIHDAEQIAERLRMLIREHKVECHNKEQLPPVSVSIGVYSIQYEDTPEQVLERVDAAMYQAKNAGRDQVKTWHGK